MTEVQDNSGMSVDESAPTSAIATKRPRTANAIARRSLRENRQQTARRPFRMAGIALAVTGMLATVALPAYAAFTGGDGDAKAAGARTLQQEAATGAQSYVVASDAKGQDVTRDSYSATSAEEIEKKKAEEAAVARAAAQKREEEQRSASSNAAFANVDLTKLPPGSGVARWPLATIRQIGEGFMARGGAHQGIDFEDPAGTPIYAAHDGVVTVSSESYYGYGVAVVVEGNMGGTQVATTYGHMTYGTRVVQAGENVKAGQMIGRVGSTGFSTGPHLHFEVRLNGGLVDPYQWLINNAGGR